MKRFLSVLFIVGVFRFCEAQTPVDLTAVMTDVRINVVSGVFQNTLFVSLRVTGADQMNAQLLVTRSVDNGPEQEIMHGPQSFTRTGTPPLEIKDTVSAAKEVILYRVKVDPLNQVTETDEGNNSTGASLSGFGPDLSFAGSSPLVSSGPGSIIIQLDVANGGRFSSNECKGNVLVDGVVAKVFTIPVLDGGTPPTSSSQKRFDFTIPSVSGLHRVEIKLDVDNQNNEAEEGNNSAVRPVKVPSPPAPPPPPPNTVTVNVAKSGSGTGSITGEGINCGSDCVTSINEGSSIVLNAQPAANSVFRKWSGGTGSATACNESTRLFCSFAVSQNSRITAIFELTQ